MRREELSYCSLREVRDLLRGREISSRELVEAQLERLDALEPRLNAFITVFRRQALEGAQSADEAAVRGENRGALHGIPLTAKDLLWTRGERTTSGSKIYADFFPKEDATAVAKVNAAGAVLLGKTNLHELAYGVSSVNPHYGPVRNPWDGERISGGSSGGSAAALAAGIGYGSIGTDTGGSIRIPSALCGTVGLKPTYGRVSRYGVTPLSWSLDHVGPMTRTVEDAAILFESLAGHDPKDPASAYREPESVGERLGELAPRLKMGVHQKYFFEQIDPVVAEAVQTAVRDLERMGLEQVEVDIPEVDHQGTCRNVIAFAEASSFHERNIRERPSDFSEAVLEMLRLGLLVQATEYLAAQRARRRVAEAFRNAFREIDLLVCPMVPVPAPKIGEEQLSNGEELRAGLLRLASPFNTVGFPAITLPCGFTPAGLPIGLQMVARPFEEGLLLQAAHAYESIHSWCERHPEFPHPL